MAKQHKRERGAEGGTLQQALRLQARAAGVGFDWPDAHGPLAKVKEEARELEHEMRAGGSGTRAALEGEVGDLLFAVVNLARKLGIDPEAALARANDKFTRRFAAVERLAAERGLEMGRATLEELDKLWEEVKRRKGS
jgi:nucleoside triphosphate diphosphatase